MENKHRRFEVGKRGLRGRNERVEKNIVAGSALHLFDIKGQSVYLARALAGKMLTADGRRD